MEKVDFELTSSHNRRPFTADYRLTAEEAAAKPVVIFLHGFKGFKDWGAFDNMAEYFAENGYAFIKMNFSHNGTTPENPHEFADLEAFGNNNFSLEMSDINTLLDHLHSPESQVKGIDLEKIALIGHSRGGSMALIKAANDPRIKAVATLAAVSDLNEQYFGDAELNERWEQDGVYYIENARTNQKMPLYHQFREDFHANGNKYRVHAAVEDLHRQQKPMIIYHGDVDPAVPAQNAKDLHHWNPDAGLNIIEGANHTFGSYHPFDQKGLPNPLLTVCKSLKGFLDTVFYEKI